MLILAVVLLLVVCAALGLRLYTLERDIRQCAKQLREGRSPRVTMAAPHRGAEELLTAVNGLLALRESDAAAYRRQDPPHLHPGLSPAPGGGYPDPGGAAGVPVHRPGAGQGPPEPDHQLLRPVPAGGGGVSPLPGAGGPLPRSQ